MNDNYDYTGEKFLNRLYKDLNNSEEVNHVMPNGNKDEKVRRYLERLEKVENLAKNSKHNGLELLKDLYYKKYVIKPENVPESYFEMQKKIALERGYGHVVINENEKKQMIDLLIQDQKKSLDIWLDYLLGDDHKYPEWFKYYAFQGMLKLGSYDKEKGKFNKRTDKTTNIFVELDREALSLTYDNLINVLNDKKVDDEVLQKLLDTSSFSKIYGYLIKKINSQTKEINGNDGIWIKYNQGTEPDELVKSLEGKGTGWCTAGYETAKQQLHDGDFYVYYTKDNNGDYKQPRIAIRMEYGEIAEVRGIAKHQNLESELEGILEEKLNEFPDKDKYKKKVSDMKKLTTIYNEYKNRGLTNEEIRFLYQIDGQITGFGYEKDPRINEILNVRNFKKDLAKILNCTEDEISNDKNDVLTGKRIAYFKGNLDLGGLTTVEGLKLPEIINGELDLSGLTTAEGLKLPEIINGHLNLNGLTTAEGLKLPEIINGHLELAGLTTAKGLKLPEIIDGYLDLRRLKSAKDLKLPKKLNLWLDLRNLKTAEGLKLPEIIDGHLILEKLTTAEGLILPRIITGDLNLKGLTTAEGLKMPKKIGVNLNLGGLTTTEGLKLPEKIGGSLDLRNLTRAEGLILPRIINGDLNLKELTTAEGLKLPEKIDGYLDLEGLTTAEGLKLPKIINGGLYLNGLTTAEGLILPETMKGFIYLNGLTTVEGLILPEIVSGTLGLGGLTIVKDLKLPKEVKGDLYLWNLTTIEEVEFPEIVDGNLYLDSLVTAHRVKLPEKLRGKLDLRNLIIVDKLKLPTILKELIISKLEHTDGLIVPENFKCHSLYSSYIEMEDLIAKSLENREQEVKRMGFANTWILLVITYIVSLIASLFIFMK